MNIGYSRYYKMLVLAGDLILLNLIVFISLFTQLKTISGSISFQGFLLHSIISFFWSVIFTLNEVHAVKRFVQYDRIFQQLLKNNFVLFSLVLSLAYITKSYKISLQLMIIVNTILFFLLFAWRIVFIKFLKHYRKSGFNYRTVVIIGAGPVGKKLKEELTSDITMGYRFIGFFDDNPEESACGNEYLGKISDVEYYLTTYQIHHVYLALPEYAYEKKQYVIQLCEQNFVECKIVPDFNKYILKKVKMEFVNQIPVVSLREEPLQRFTNRLIKRVFDVSLTFIALLILLPTLFPIIALLIKLSSKGPIFFEQPRSGKNNKPFSLYKFRSMRMNDHAHKVQAKKGDNRITPIGAFLRKTSLDELPQLLNVFMGDMTLVGPRPHMLAHTEEYSKLISGYMVRHLVKPGLTGFAQVMGYRGETDTTRKMQKRIQYDVWYIENWTFFLDIWIVFKTALNIIKGEDNAH